MNKSMGDRERPERWCVVAVKRRTNARFCDEMHKMNRRSLRQRYSVFARAFTATAGHNVDDVSVLGAYREMRTNAAAARRVSANQRGSEHGATARATVEGEHQRARDVTMLPRTPAIVTPRGDALDARIIRLPAVRSYECATIRCGFTVMNNAEMRNSANARKMTVCC